MNEIVGVIGVGHLARYLVAGFAHADAPPEIVLSPRNAATSRMLADRFGATVAASNAEVVERADVVLLATRPPDLIEAATGLPWRDGQTAVSLAAGVALSGLSRTVSPATAVRALPITAAEIGESPTCLHPDNAAAGSDAIPPDPAGTGKALTAPARHRLPKPEVSISRRPVRLPCEGRVDWICRGGAYDDEAQSGDTRGVAGGSAGAAREREGAGPSR